MTILTKTPEEMKKDSDSIIEPYETDDVPYGLQINLADRELDKLGIKVDGLQIGAEMDAAVKLRVDGKHESSGREGDHRNLSLAIVEMDLDTPARSRASTLYGDE